MVTTEMRDCDEARSVPGQFIQQARRWSAQGHGHLRSLSIRHFGQRAYHPHKFSCEEDPPADVHVCECVREKEMTTEKDACPLDGASLFGGSLCKADECQFEVVLRDFQEGVTSYCLEM